MSDYGLRVSQPGYDVLTETDDSRMMVTTKFNNVKVQGIYNAVSVANLGAYTYANGTHGLGYVPMALGFFYNTTLGAGTYAPAAWSDPVVGDCIMDVNTQVVRVYPPFATGGSSFGRVVIFIEQAA